MKGNGLDMTNNTEHPNKIFFWLELTVALIIPVVVIWSTTPTNVLNSNAFFKLLEIIGIWGGTVVFFIGLPVGIIGIRKAKRTGKLRAATIALSILNLSAGIIENAMLIAIFCAVIFGGASA